MGMAVEVEISDEEYGVLLRGAEKRSISMKEMCGNMVSIFLGGYMLDKEPRQRESIFETMKSVLLILAIVVYVSLLLCLCRTPI